MRSCLPCPGSDMTSPPASHHVDQCRCREGFTYKRGQCVVMDCPANLPPENGYFIRNECKNVFNSACGVRCNSGYQVSNNLLTHCLGHTQYCRCQAPVSDSVSPLVNGVGRLQLVGSRRAGKCLLQQMDLSLVHQTIMLWTPSVSLGKC